jgi:hypothetical protein
VKSSGAACHILECPTKLSAAAMEQRWLREKIWRETIRERKDMAGKDDDTDEKMVGKCHVAIRSIRHPIQGAYLVAENEMNRSQHLCS